MEKYKHYQKKRQNFTSYCSLKNIYKYPYNKDIYRIKGKCLDFKLTPEHKMYYNWNLNQQWQLKPLKDLNLNSKAPLLFKHSFNWKGKESFPKIEFKVHNEIKEIDFKVWLEFLGWFISEGHLTKEKNGSYKIGLTQFKSANPEKFELMRKTLEKLPFSFWCLKEKHFYFSNKTCFDHLKKHCYVVNENSKIRVKSKYCCYNKVIPSYVKHLPKEYLEIILKFFHLGDGNTEKGLKRFSTSSKLLADDLQEIYLKTGHPCSIRTKKKNRNPLYVVSELKSKTRRINLKGHLTKESYKGMVWCVETTPHNMILVRRNGRCIWTGNSKSPGRQWFGKHVKFVFLEEACVSGRTRVSCIDKLGNRKTLRISDLVNNGLWKKYDIFSYNFEAKKLEVKPITKIFKKQVKDYTRYRVEVFCYDSNRKRVIEASKLQKFFTTTGTKYAPELEPGDLIYNKDYQKLNPIQDQIMLGCLLGDTSMSKRENCNPSVSFCHGKSQEDYLKYKIEIFKNIFGNNYRVQNKKDLVFNITEKGGRVTHITSDRTVDLKKFVTLKIKGKINLEVVKKYFSDISLAFWVMDDGSLGFAKTKTFAGTKYLTLHTEQFKYESVNALCSFLNKRYNITGRVRSIKRRDKEYFVITFDNDSTRVLSSIIRKYLPYYFYYKVFHSKELCRIIGNDIKFKFEDLSSISYDYLDTYPVIKIQPIKSKTWTMYDVEVKDNHNFFANGLLVHNSLETQQVYDKRICAISEVGAVIRASGMTDYGSQSPAAKAVNDPINRNHVINYPQYVSPLYDSAGFKVYVKGEVITDGKTTFDMERIRKACFSEDRNGNSLKQIKRFEIDKEAYPYFRNRIVVERPKNAERIFLSSDIGKDVTEIIVHSEIGRTYHYLYNIVLYNLTQQEKEKVFDYLIIALEANVIALDCGDGEGRGIYSYLEQKYPTQNLVYYSGNKKIEVDFEYNEDKTVKIEKGEPVYRYEPHCEFAVQRLKNLLYDGRIKIPEDFKFVSQFSVVMGIISGNRIIYKCVCKSGDHL